jgi:hypothetical protein
LTIADSGVDARIVTGIGATEILMAIDRDCAGLLLSATVVVKVDVPFTAGTPEMRPVEGVSVRPVGRLPDVSDHEYGVVPPDAFRVCEYAVPTVTDVRAGVAIVRGLLATEMVNGWEVVCTGWLWSFRFTVKLATPLVVGVPEIVPVDESERPAGRLPDTINQV